MVHLPRSKTAAFPAFAMESGQFSQATQPLDGCQFKDSQEEDPSQPQVWGRLYPLRKTLKPITLQDKLEYTFGRGEDCDVRFNVQNIGGSRVKAISKEQFRVRFMPGNPGSKVPPRAILEDLSTNGTFVDGLKVEKGKSVALKNNALITMLVKEFQVYVYMDPGSSDALHFPPQIREKYIISRLLGEGACGKVHVAFRRGDCEQFAIKVIHKASGTSVNIMNEVKVLQALNHPCVTRVEEVLDTQRSLFIVLELMEGGELFDRIQKNDKKRLTEDLAKLYFYQMALAVQYLHRNKVTHRDLKPENILLGSTEAQTLVKVSDFGLSKLIQAETQMQTFCGTPTYLAPEIVRGQGRGIYTNKVDCWSLGVILYICLLGYQPFNVDHPTINIQDQILTGRIYHNRAHWNGISQEAKDVVYGLIQVDPEKRFSMEQVLEHKWIKEDDKMKSVAHQLIGWNEIDMDEDVEEFPRRITRSSPKKRRRVEGLQLHFQ